MKSFASLVLASLALTAMSATNVLWMTSEGPTSADTFLALRDRLKALRAAHPGDTVELRSLDAPEAAVAEMLRFTNGTDVVCGDLYIELPATRVLQSGGGGTRPPGWWEDRLARNLRFVRACGGEIDLVLLGDSITHFWERSGGAAWSELTNRFCVLNAGYGGDSARHLIWREINGELDGYRAKVAVLMIGTNNRGKPEHIARAVAKSVRILRKKHPETKIVVMALFPRGADARDPNRIRNDRVNALLKPMLAALGVTWLDISDRFLRSDGTLPKAYFKDLLHPTGAGYRIWLEALRPHLPKSGSSAFLTAEPLANADVLEPSVQNEVSHALAVASVDNSQRTAASVSFEAFYATNGLSATDRAIALVSTQKDGCWFWQGTNVTSVAVRLLRELSPAPSR